ncbi:solute carrier organic anion transporter family member 2A1-like [Aricia agestis]|uniref:solute carrier organic anion transporter family member 2A1-like n=1 Tax=Aricia agestis TaxID=91739 RepID=UPI001C202123|nr:solute carrier organic anion transporter family member 2A1-like [Aricia agestis]
MVKMLVKGWHLLRRYILTVERFDLFLQGALLVTVFLETNVQLLLRRTAGHYLPSVDEDWLSIGAGGAEFLFGAFVSWWGRGKRQLALAGWLGLTAAAGLVVLAFPFPDAEVPRVELCGGDPITAYNTAIPKSEVSGPLADHDPLATGRTVALAATTVLCALTKISVWAHGFTYLDDHQPENGPYFYGILISIRLSLGLSGRNWLRAASLSSTWWEPQLSLAALTLMFSILFTLFPRKQPGAEIEEPELDCILNPLGRLLRNRAMMLQALSMSLLLAAVFGYVKYDNELVQSKFNVESERWDPRTARTAHDIFRSLVIIFLVSVFRMRFSGRRRDGVKTAVAARVGGVAAAGAAVLFAALAAMTCRAATVAGADDVYTQPECSSSCGCQSELYGFSPVCAVDSATTYYSPCHAGCHEYEDLNGYLIFGNCTCGTGSLRAVRGGCGVDDCWTIYSVYLVLYTVVLAVTGAALLMQGMGVARATSRRDKPLAFGATFALAGLLANVLGYALYVLIGHVTCMYYSGGACALQGGGGAAVGGASAALAALSAAASVLAGRAASTVDIPTR